MTVDYYIFFFIKINIVMIEVAALHLNRLCDNIEYIYNICLIKQSLNNECLIFTSLHSDNY